MKVAFLQSGNALDSKIASFIQRKFEIPHVAFKFEVTDTLSEGDYDHIVAVTWANDVSDDYKNFVEEFASIQLSPEMLGHPEQVTQLIFDTLKLEDQNYMTKTGSTSLYNDIMSVDVKIIY